MLGEPGFPRWEYMVGQVKRLSSKGKMVYEWSSSGIYEWHLRVASVKFPRGTRAGQHHDFRGTPIPAEPATMFRVNVLKKPVQFIAALAENVLASFGTVQPTVLTAWFGHQSSIKFTIANVPEDEADDGVDLEDEDEEEENDTGTDPSGSEVDTS